MYHVGVFFFTAICYLLFFSLSLCDSSSQDDGRLAVLRQTWFCFLCPLWLLSVRFRFQHWRLGSPPCPLVSLGGRRVHCESRTAGGGGGGGIAVDYLLLPPVVAYTANGTHCVMSVGYVSILCATFRADHYYTRIICYVIQQLAVVFSVYSTCIQQQQY